ncbi:MAG: hypothetical protein WBZ36_25655, partial [Candidatus Nitrosopolaris sp.]
MNGIDIFSLNDSQLATVRNNNLGFIFQSYNLINSTTVLKNVEFPGIIGCMSDADRRRRALKLAICDFDAYSSGLNFVFGQAQIDGRVSAIYLTRLRQEFYGLD